MKLIKPKAEIILQQPGLEGIYKQIELAGRTCYKSEDKIVDVINIDVANLPKGITVKDIPNYKTNQQQCIEYLHNHKIKYQIISSAKGFVDRMIKSNHLAMLEHGTVYLDLPNSTRNYDAVEDYSLNKYSKLIVFEGKDRIHNYVTTNLRVLVENDWLYDLEYICEPTEHHVKRYTFKVTTSIGVTREFNRHRVDSIAEQSTRYCNYSKDKFGNEVKFCIPEWCHSLQEDVLSYSPFEITSEEAMFMDSIFRAEKDYISLLDKGWSPQQAREVLPLCTATEIVHTAFESDWKHFFDLRLRGTTGKPHPNMQELAELMYEQLKQKGIEL